MLLLDHHLGSLEWTDTYLTDFLVIEFLLTECSYFGLMTVLVCQIWPPNSLVLCWSQVYQMDFVIICIGMYNGLPMKPDFLINEGPEVFEGKVLHSMDYAMMNRDHVAELVKERQVTVVGFQKSALDIAAEVSKWNGTLFMRIKIAA